MSRAPRVLLVKKWNGNWGLPGGGIEKGETPIAAALRELEEETGLRTNRAEHIGEFQRSHGRVSLFLIRKRKTKGKLCGKTDEIKKQRWVRPETALRLLAHRKADRLARALELVSGA